MKKISLITGASTGIGKACAQKFIQEGYFVLIHGRRTENPEIIAEFGEDNAAYLGADFLNEQEIFEMFKKIKNQWKKIDVLINNAGIVKRKPDDDLTVADFQELFMVNLTAPFFCAREAHHLGATAIINIGSIRGLPSGATSPAYSASKAGIHNLTESLAKEFAPNCRVNCVAPGFTLTPLHEDNLERLHKEAEKTPLKMYAEASDIAEAVYFLASEKARFVTGEIMVVDGGRSLV